MLLGRNITIHRGVGGSTTIHKDEGNGKSTTKGNGDGEVRIESCSKKKVRNLGQSYTFGERY